MYSSSMDNLRHFARRFGRNKNVEREENLLESLHLSSKSGGEHQCYFSYFTGVMKVTP